MNIVWLSWKDSKHPAAGGAEFVSHTLLSRLAKDGHQVTLLTARPKGASAEDTIDGYRVIRQGNRFSVYWKTFRYYRKHFATPPDLVIEEVNTIPFFSRFYAHAPSSILCHQLARNVWFFQMPWPISWIGYVLEPLYLRLIARERVITISNSTREDLVRHGFRRENIQTIRLGIELQPVEDIQVIEKYERPTLLSLGSVRPMKRTIDIIKAFPYAKSLIPDLQLIVAGNASGPYGEKALETVAASPYKDDIQVLGSVSFEKKEELMRRAHVMAVTSIKEGWGLVVTEANSQGTPVVAYDVDGLRDSVKSDITGFVTPENPKALGEAIARLLQDPATYAKMRQAAWDDSKQYTRETMYQDFLSALPGLTTGGEQHQTSA